MGSIKAVNGTNRTTEVASARIRLVIRTTAAETVTDPVDRGFTAITDMAELPTFVALDRFSVKEFYASYRPT